MSKPYKLVLTNDEADAIYWHGYRYSVSDFLTRRMHQTDDETAHEIELTEAQAWELRSLWDEEGALACGSSELNSKLQGFIASIV